MDDGGGVWPVGRQDDRFVSRVEHAADRHVERLHTGGGDQDFQTGVEPQSVKLMVLFSDGLPQARQTGVFGVKGVAFIQGPDGRLFDEGRGRQVGFSEMNGFRMLKMRR